MDNNKKIVQIWKLFSMYAHALCEIIVCDIADGLAFPGRVYIYSRFALDFRLHFAHVGAHLGLRHTVGFLARKQSFTVYTVSGGWPPVGSRD
jgi:hypothetical protein